MHYITLLWKPLKHQQCCKMSENVFQCWVYKNRKKKCSKSPDQRKWSKKKATRHSSDLQEILEDFETSCWICDLCTFFLTYNWWRLFKHASNGFTYDSKNNSILMILFQGVQNMLWSAHFKWHFICVWTVYYSYFTCTFIRGTSGRNK